MPPKVSWVSCVTLPLRYGMAHFGTFQVKSRDCLDEMEWMWRSSRTILNHILELLCTTNEDVFRGRGWTLVCPRVKVLYHNSTYYSQVCHQPTKPLLPPLRPSRRTMSCAVLCSSHRSVLCENVHKLQKDISFFLDSLNPGTQPKGRESVWWITDQDQKQSARRF